MTCQPASVVLKTSLKVHVVPPAGDMSGGRWGPFWDRLVFSKVRERLGGRVKYMTTGEAGLQAQQ